MENTQQNQQQAQTAAVAMTDSQKLATILFNSEKGAVEYDVAGQTVKLSYNIVRNFLTKGSTAVSDADIVQFIQICKFNQLNPFLGEAYLVKYGDQPAQMITSKEALMKRAEANEHYKGYSAGIIVVRDGNIMELDGTFKLKTDELVGGWAKVFRDDRNEIHQTVALNEFNKGKSTWTTMPCTMIRKVALVQALREAFPAQLGAMYTVEESNAVHDTVDVSYQDVTDKVEAEIAQNANQAEIGIQSDEPEPVQEDVKPAAETRATGAKSGKSDTKAPF